jgi:hypothetical protein
MPGFARPLRAIVPLHAALVSPTPRWPALASLALLLAEELQIGFGYARMLALHVPLGVASFGLTTAMLVGTGRLTRPDAASKAQPRTPVRS